MKDEHIQQAKNILQVLEDKLEKTNIQNKINALYLMRASRIYNYRILDYMLSYSELNFDLLTYEDVLYLVITVNQARMISPYELMYKLRNRFYSCYTELKPYVVLKTLGLFCKMRLMYME